jgi:hypothetical protein
MTAAYDQASGLVAASDLSDAAYDRMINFNGAESDRFEVCAVLPAKINR